MDKVICLEENSSKTGLSDWIILEVKFVKAMERIRMSLQQLVTQFSKYNIEFREQALHACPMYQCSGHKLSD